MLVATWAISTWFNLYTLKWLMNQMFTFGIVTVLIIFQPELRRVLEQLGRGKLFARSYSLDKDIVNEQIEGVIKAIRFMAGRKIGALIVFERGTGLNELIESGIRMESRITSELLINIFTPNTPLHDGAVIIRSGQIMAAG
ncbi:DisA bacterial checkpoint controller nucleotide-binding protein [compost metagenome]